MLSKKMPNIQTFHLFFHKILAQCVFLFDMMLMTFKWDNYGDLITLRVWYHSRIPSGLRRKSLPSFAAKLRQIVK